MNKNTLLKVRLYINTILFAITYIYITGFKLDYIFEDLYELYKTIFLGSISVAILKPHAYITSVIIIISISTFVIVNLKETINLIKYNSIKDGEGIGQDQEEYLPKLKSKISLAVHLISLLFIFVAFKTTCIRMYNSPLIAYLFGTYSLCTCVADYCIVLHIANREALKE